VFLRFLLLILGRRAGIEPPKHRSEIAAVEKPQLHGDIGDRFLARNHQKVREKACAGRRKPWRQEQKGTVLKGRKGEAA
jgi:hypothetical protein